MKGDHSFVGAGGEEAYVEAELDLPAELEELADLRPEDEDALLLARRVFADGRTRAYAWGRAAAREDVAAAVERVVAMSGQFEQRRLARPSYQLAVLDRFCGEEQLARRSGARAAWRELQSARRRHDELLARRDEARAELDALEDGSDPAEVAARELAEAEARVQALALDLRAERNAAAPAFADAVAGELRGVGMGEGEFLCELRERDEPGSTGADAAVFLARPNAGLPFAPVPPT